MIPFPFILSLLSNWQKYLVIGFLILAAAGTVWMHGYFKGEQELHEYKGKQAIESVRIIRQIVNLVGKTRDLWHTGETRYVTEFVYIEQESSDVPVRAACNVTAGWVRSHNAAASADKRELGAVDDPTPTGVTEAAALAIVRENYRYFYQVANDLKACRAFVGGLPEATQ